MQPSEPWELQNDLADLRRAAGDAGAIHLAGPLFDAWRALPEADRQALRGRFSLRIVPGDGALVGVPSYGAAGRPAIILGAGVDDPGLALIHEAAHVFLSHCDLGASYTGPALVVAWTVPPAVFAAGAADGLTKIDARPLTPAEADREKAAWQQVAKWGFSIPSAWE